SPSRRPWKMRSCRRSPTSRRPSTGWPAGEEDEVTTIQMPQLGETIVEGTILKWLKREGDAVDRDEPLFEISTDKVDTEVPAPAAAPPAAPAPAPAAAPAPAPAAAPAAAMANVPDRGPRSQILSPLVRRLAKEHDLDLAQVAGTGSGGRITKADVMEVISSG